MHCSQKFGSLRCDRKTNTNLFLLPHNFIDKRLVLTVDLSDLSVRFFSFPIKENFHLST